MSAPAAPLVVFGGGALGGAVARLGALRGLPVTVASRNPGDHPGWWLHHRVGSAAPLGWLPPRAQVVLAVGPVGNEPAAAVWGAPLAEWLPRLRALRPTAVVVAGPAGLAGGGIEAFDRTARVAHDCGFAVVRLPALLATERGWAGALAGELRRGVAARVSTALPDARALTAEDAARAVLAEVGSHADVTLTGPARVRAADVVDALAARYELRPRARLFGTGLAAEVRARLSAQSELPDAWDEARYGPRADLATWADRQPGPRRKRTPTG